MEPIYICVTPFFPTPTAWQGAYVLDQVKAIHRNSCYKVIVFRTLPLGTKEYKYEIDGIIVYAITPLLMPSYIFNGATEDLVGRLFVRTINRLGIDIKNISYVHCHTVNHSAFGFGLKRINPQIKVMVQFHDLDPLNLRNGIFANKTWNLRFRARKSINAINRADLLICISELVKNVLEAFPAPREQEVYEKALKIYHKLKDMPLIQPKDLYVLNNGVDISLFNRDHSQKDNNIFRIGCVANFQDLKDHETLVKAFNILVKKGYNDMRLSLLGSGETKSKIESFLMKEGIYDKVEWPSEVTHNLLPDYYRTLNLFVLPSIYEGFGCVYTEAYACGVPFICCENQGASECIDVMERNKWLVKPKSPIQLAALIERYYIERDEQRLCKPYDINILIRNFIKYIESK